jgi:hypothetical protein
MLQERNKKAQATLIVLALILIIVLILLAYFSFPSFEQSQYNLTITSLPNQSLPGQPFVVNWQIEGNGTASESALVYSSKQISNPKRISDFEFVSQKLCMQGCVLPQVLSFPINISQAGQYYIRAYAVINNNSYWSEEHKINITD